jgi:hypothetical protein
MLAVLREFFNWCEKNGFRQDHTNPALHIEPFKERERKPFLDARYRRGLVVQYQMFPGIWDRFVTEALVWFRSAFRRPMDLSQFSCTNAMKLKQICHALVAQPTY